MAINDDPGTIQWILGGIVAAGAGIARYLSGRIAEAATNVDEEHARLWAAIEDARRSHEGFKESTLREMATKSDLREMESRIISVIKGNRS